MNLLDLARAAIPDRPPDSAQPATPEQAAELRALIAVILANDSDADRAEGLAVALADPDAALTSFRLLAASAANCNEIQPDDRRPCTACANLTAGDHRCLAAWRGEPLGHGHGRTYRPAIAQPRRCIGYRPKAHDDDQRTGAERWPSLTRESP